ncbi:MAG: toll/interleukin-1 receptor domain-containing protein [Reyranella sp.]|uniref:toll/interleukin-1 receptor domain-containing protein n=1 Tax=Reyranella sp. TaxID=1929291 RepID=UPI00121E1EA0|nr:toll/interleukin-1 receptor domain-containing protein [Reyranella sp.]TAJ35670.1 MAG: toll/interleukin-1 receptor domain-containing protein [Reyranella sp.]
MSSSLGTKSDGNEELPDLQRVRPKLREVGVHMNNIIFLSHVAADKPYVDEVRSKLDQSNVFYDLKSIAPGESNLAAMKDGVLRSTVFCLFISPATKASPWVGYEQTLAEVQSVKASSFTPIVVPINSATYRDAPEWMRGYFSTSASFLPSDIARLISAHHFRNLVSSGQAKESLLAGREEFLFASTVRVNTRRASTNKPVNFLIMSGIESMGRKAFASNLIPRLFPTETLGGPFLDIARFADSLDLHLSLLDTIHGQRSQSRTEQEKDLFQKMTAAEQAQTIHANLRHFGELNQTVIVRSAFGLRDKDRNLKPWLQNLVTLLQSDRSSRIFWISERRISDAVLLPYPNVIDINVPEISEPATTELLSALVGRDKIPPPVASTLGRLSGGHPGTVHHAASLINNSGRSAESLTTSDGAITSYQDSILRETIKSYSNKDDFRSVLHVVALLPRVKFDDVLEVLGGQNEQLRATLDELVDACLVSFSQETGYRMPEVARAAARRVIGPPPDDLVGALVTYFNSRLKAERIDQQTVEALLYLTLRTTGEMPEVIKRIVTPATLQSAVEATYQRGLAALDESFRTNFLLVAKLSHLVDAMPMPPDIAEDILYMGADALSRIADDPTPIIEVMRRKGFASANYAMGNYQFYRLRDNAAAIVSLERALAGRSYVKRTSRLLARLYLLEGRAAPALEVLNKLGDSRVLRDSGLLSQKIKALRALGRRAEAAQLLPNLQALNDDYGEYHMNVASDMMRAGRVPDALAAVRRAKERPRANQQSLLFLECALMLDLGDFGLFDHASAVANAAGRSDDLSHLRARAALAHKDWREAERQWGLIQRPGRTDRYLLVRILESKLSDPVIAGSTTEMADVRRVYEETLGKLANSPEVFDR